MGFGFTLTSNLDKYLRVFLLHKRVTSYAYGYIVNQVNSKLDGWSAKTLSLAGSATLIGSNLSVIPI